MRSVQTWAFASFRHRSRARLAPLISPSSLLHAPLSNGVPVSAKCKADKSEQDQDGPGYHQSVRVLHRGEHVVHLQPRL
jgi:hypothetical protein